MTHNGNSICDKSLVFIKDSKEINSPYYLLKMFVCCLRLCLSNWKWAEYIIFCCSNANINVSVGFFMVDLIISSEMGHSCKIITGNWNQLHCIDKVYCFLWNHLKRHPCEFHSEENFGYKSPCALCLPPETFGPLETYFMYNVNRVLHI